MLDGIEIKRISTKQTTLFWTLAISIFTLALSLTLSLCHSLSVSWLSIRQYGGIMLNSCQTFSSKHKCNENIAKHGPNIVGTNELWCQQTFHIAGLSYLRTTHANVSDEWVDFRAIFILVWSKNINWPTYSHIDWKNLLIHLLRLDAHQNKSRFHLKCERRKSTSEKWNVYEWAQNAQKKLYRAKVNMKHFMPRKHSLTMSSSFRLHVKVYYRVVEYIVAIILFIRTHTHRPTFKGSQCWTTSCTNVERWGLCRAMHWWWCADDKNILCT